MTLNIPNYTELQNPLMKGIETGSSMFSKLMQPVLEREKQKQQAEQFEKELALRKQAEARMGANSGLKRQVLEQNLLKLKHSNDPQWAMKQLQAKLEYIQNLRKQGGQSGAGGQAMGGQQQPPVNLMDMINQGQGQEMPQGQGAMMPQEEPQQQQMMPGQEQEQPQGGNKVPGKLNFEEIKRALTYQALGLPIPRNSTSGITPEMREREYLYKQKSLDERMRHNKAMEKLANPDEKIRLAQEKAKIEAEKQQNINDHKADLEYTKSLNKEEGKTFSKMQDEAISGIKAQPVLDEMKSIVSDPILEQIRQHPYLGHYELGYYRRSGTPEQKQLIARFDVAANKVIADTAKGLNTRFTDKDLALAREMKIKDDDSLDAMKAKAESLAVLHEIGQHRLDKAIEIASSQRISPYAAFKQADAAINGDEIRKGIRKQIYGSENKLPSGITEADIDETKRATGLTRDQIINEFKRKHGG
jgi:hypothetical protein